LLLFNVFSVFAFVPPDGLCTFDLNSYTGGWYELASSAYIGETLESGCICPVAYYTTNDTSASPSLDVTNSCIRNGNYYSVSGKIHSASAGEPQGNLLVTLNSTVTNSNNSKNGNESNKSNYIVLKLYYAQNKQNNDTPIAPQYALVGGDIENYWWLLGRTPNWNDTIWNNANYVLQGNDYNVTAYRMPKQTCRFLGEHGPNILPPQA
jgi:lipocalin